jgi:nucleoid-associated protein YgaU
MRKDVKFGMALSLVVVVVAGWYYTRDGESRQPIPLADGAASPTVSGEDARGDEGRPEAPASTSAGNSVDLNRPVNPPSRSTGTDVSGRGTEFVFDDDDAPADATKPADVRQASADPTTTRTPSGGESSEPAGGTSRAAAQDSSAKPTSVTDAVELYKAQPGDTYAVLADVYYGDRRYAEFLRSANPRITESQGLLPRGAVVKLPALPDAIRNQPVSQRGSAPSQASAPVTATSTAPATARPGGAEPASAQPVATETRTYTVKRGDGFYLIAKRVLGAGSRWPEIFELNKALVDGDVHGLKPGMVLNLPAQ